MRTIGFIGAGKCGVSLAHYFRSKGVPVSGFSSRGEQPGDFARLSREELVRKSDMVFLTVTDNAIAQVWDDIRHLDLTGKIVCHCSGAISSDIFVGADPAMVCSVHPMLAFPGKPTAIEAVSEAFFTIEGGKTAVEQAENLLSTCGNRYKVIAGENKVKYHAAACFASNFVVSVCYEAVKLLTECGFDEEEAQEALRALMRRNMENIISVGCRRAITGPAARGDTETIERHLQVLNEKERTVYQGLTDLIYEMKENLEGNENDNRNL